MMVRIRVYCKAYDDGDFFSSAFGYRYFRHNCTYFKKYRSEDSTQSHCLTVRRLIIYIVQEPAMNERTNERT